MLHNMQIRRVVLVVVGAAVVLSTGEYAGLSHSSQQTREPARTVRGSPATNRELYRLDRTLTGHIRISAVAFSHDGLLLASSSDLRKGIELWDLTTGVLKKTIALDGPIIYCLAFSHDGRTLASGGDDDTIQLWDIENFTVKRTLTGYSRSSLSNTVYGVAFAPDDLLLASANSDNTVELWDVTTGRPPRTLRGHVGYVHSVAFSPDGTLLASGGGSAGDPSVRIWDVATGTIKQVLKGHTALAYSVAFSPKGDLLASGSLDSTIKVWDASIGSLKYNIPRADFSFIRSVAFSPNGQLLASGGESSLKLWDVATGMLRQDLQGHSGSIGGVAFSPDGRFLATGAETIKLWKRVD